MTMSNELASWPKEGCYEWRVSDENVRLQKLGPVHYNAHFHLCYIMLCLEISQLHLNPLQNIMWATKKHTPPLTAYAPQNKMAAT